MRFKEGFDVIDDSYNSNPKALTEMIRFLGKLQGYKRKIVVAGEMLELGSTAAELHRSCGREAAMAGAALIVGVQGEARSVLEGAREAGVDESRLGSLPIPKKPAKLWRVPSEAETLYWSKVHAE